MSDLMPDVWTSLGGAPEELGRIRFSGPPAVLRSTFPVTDVGAAAVGASLLAATRGVPVAVDTAVLAVALRSERYVRLDGRAVGSPFDPLSAFDIGPAPHLVDLDAPDGRLTLTRPPGTVDGRPMTWPAPAPSYGTARPSWDCPPEA